MKGASPEALNKEGMRNTRVYSTVNAFIRYIAGPEINNQRKQPYAFSRPFFAPSSRSFASFCPFSTNFSIRSCALRTSSARAIFFFCRSCRCLCIPPRESRIAPDALSHACRAACTFWSRDSLVGGGIGMLSCSELCGSGCGVRDRAEPMIAEVIGLTC